MMRHAATARGRTSLDQLQSENLVLRDLFERIDSCRGPSVEDRYEYGILAKQVIQHLAIRQSSLMNVAAGVSQIPPLCSTGVRMLDRGTDRRRAYDEVGDIARNVPVMSLNIGQDFDGPFTALIRAASSEMEWELADAIPLIRRTLSPQDLGPLLGSARYVQRHAPTKLSRTGPRWYERAPIISRVVTIYDRLRDFPARHS